MNLNILPNVHFFADVRFRSGGYEAPRILYDHELVYVSAGKNDITINAKRHVVGAGQGIVIPPQVAHFSENPYAEVAFRHCVHFDWYGTQPTPGQLSMFLKDDKRGVGARAVSEQPLEFTLSADLAGLMDKVLGLLRDKPQEVISIRYAFGELLAHVVAGKSAGGEDWDATAWGRLDMMQELKGFIDGNYAGNIGYEDFRAVTQRSSAYLCVNFKKVTGLSPTEYLILVRLSHAQRLLRGTALSIDEICERVGIPDHNYFSRLFRKRNNVSPSEYREQAAAPN